MTEADKQKDKEEGADVQKRLIRTAIDQYGHRGTQVSLRAIQREAGVLNEAAIRYYFGSKDGLLDACMASLAARFIPVAERMIAQSLADGDGQKVTVRDVAVVLVGAFYTLQLSDAAGIKLIARMIREEGKTGQDLLVKHFGKAIWMLEAELQKVMPEKPLKAIRLHMFLAINNTVNGLVDQELLWRLPPVEEGKEHYCLSESELAFGFIDYITAGMGVASPRAGKS